MDNRPLPPAAVIAGLPSYTPEELREFRDKASALLTLAPSGRRVQLRVVRGAAVNTDAFVRGLFDALSNEIQRRTGVSVMPYGAFAGTRFYERFLSAARTAEAANATWFPKQTAAERLSMTRLYAKLVVDHIAYRMRPAVWLNIADALEELPAVVDRAFPGYAAAGLLGKVQALRTRGPQRGAAPAV